MSRRKPRTRPRNVGAEYARANLPELLTRVEEGEAIEISRRGRKVAVLMSAREARVPFGSTFTQLRGTGRRQWGDDIAQTISDLRDEWD